MYRVSIIIPIFKVRNFIERCVCSLFEQTLTAVEYIFGDDASPDDSIDILKACIERYPERKEQVQILVHEQNQGLPAARNTGLAVAKGEYVFHCDSDDFVEPDMYEKLYGGIVKYGTLIAQIGRDEIDAEGNMLPNICEPPAEPMVYSAEEFLKELLMHRGDCSFCTKLVHRSLFEDKGFPIGLLNEDFRLLVEMLPQAGKLVSLPGQTYHVFYRIGSNSRKQNKEDFSRVFADSVDNADMVAGIVEREFEDLKKVAFRFGIFQRLDYLLHIPVSQMTKDNAF